MKLLLNIVWQHYYKIKCNRFLDFLNIDCVMVSCMPKSIVFTELWDRIVVAKN